MQNCLGSRNFSQISQRTPCSAGLSTRPQRHHLIVKASASPDDSATRRRTLQALVASVATIPARKAFAAEEDSRQGEIAHSDKEWQALLPGDSYYVLRKAGTERPFSSPLYTEHRKGVFACAGCNSDLFTSEAKYDSGTGWPSFYEAIPGAVDETLDTSIFFMPRTEIRCHKCKGHLGHSFPDGPAPTGLRYCMNGAALVFQPSQA